jgi:hypothetical protein
MSIIQQHHPSSEDWPFVAVEGFETIVKHLLESSSGVDMGFVPLIRVEQQDEWERFAYEYYHSTRRPYPFPITTGISSFGKGIWAINTTDIMTRRGKLPTILPMILKY